MKKYLIIFSLIFFCKGSYAQTTLARVDSNSIEHARITVNNFLGNNSNKTNYLLLNLSHRIVFIYTVGTSYKIYTGINRNSYKKLDELDSQIVIKSPILYKCFNKTICNPSYVYMKTESVVMANMITDTEYIYFVISKLGKKVCEFNIPISYESKSGKKIKIPLDQKTLKYLIKFMNDEHLFEK